MQILSNLFSTSTLGLKKYKQGKPRIQSPLPQSTGDIFFGRKRKFDNSLLNLKAQINDIAKEASFSPYLKQAEGMVGRSFSAAQELRELLKKKGIYTFFSWPNHYQPLHNYLTGRLMGREIIIDPALSEIIKGYNQVFVGTRKGLRRLFFDSKTELVNTPWHEQAKPRAFHRYIGHHSKKNVNDRFEYYAFLQQQKKEKNRNKGDI